MALQKAVGDLGPNPSPRDVLNAVTKTKTYNPASKQNLFKNYLGASEFEEVQRSHKANEEISGLKKTQDELKEKNRVEADKNDALALIDAAEIEEDEKEAYRERVNSGKASYKAVSQILKPKKSAESQFQKTLSKEHVKQYIEAEKSLVQSQRNLKDLDRVEELNKVVGITDAANPFSEEAAELEALGFGVIEPIVKTFNPTGPIAEKKLAQLKARYGINKWDTKAEIRGKAAALRRYAGYAKDIAAKRIELFKEYNGSPPIGEIARLDVEGEAITEKMLQEDPSKPSIFYSVKDGSKIQPKSLEQQEDLIKRGLITDKKPGANGG